VDARKRARPRAREQEGLVRECHGDLHSANIVRWRDRLLPFDCIDARLNLNMNFLRFVRYGELRGQPYAVQTILPFGSFVQAKVNGLTQETAGRSHGARCHSFAGCANAAAGIPALCVVAPGERLVRVCGIFGGKRYIDNTYQGLSSEAHQLRGFIDTFLEPTVQLQGMIGHDLYREGGFERSVLAQVRLMKAFR
jgi:hypothetical protein